MSERVIPVEAVEAAARALTVEVYGVDMFDGMSDDAQEVLRRRGTFLLEAAAPYMQAQALEVAAKEIIAPGASSTAAAWLIARAAELRSK
jgi:hypothetical protein